MHHSGGAEGSALKGTDAMIVTRPLLRLTNLQEKAASTATTEPLRRVLVGWI